MKTKKIYFNGQLFEFDPNDIPAFEKGLKQAIDTHTGQDTNVNVSLDGNCIEITTNICVPQYQSRFDNLPAPLVKLILGYNAKYKPQVMGFPGMLCYIDDQDVQSFYKKNARSIHASRIKGFDASYLEGIGLIIRLDF